MPLSSKKASQCSDKVKSGLDFSCSGSHCLKALPFTEGLPGILWMSTSPVWRLLFSQRLMVERETPKRSEASFLGMPRSIAESTFSLRSFEYAFMDLFLYRSATYASRCKYSLLTVAVGGGGDDLGAIVGDDYVVLVVGAAYAGRLDAPLDCKAHTGQDHGGGRRLDPG